MVDGVPYRIPIIPKAPLKKTDSNTSAFIRKADSDTENKTNSVAKVGKKTDHDAEVSEEKLPLSQSNGQNKLNLQKSRDFSNSTVTDKNIRALSTQSSVDESSVSTKNGTYRKQTLSSESSEQGIVSLAKSPRMSNDYTEGKIVPKCFHFRDCYRTFITFIQL
jgi:hypothetical protein